MKVFFWPMKALESPAPLETTLLASDKNFGRVEKDPATEDDFVTVSTRTDDVSCRECPPDRRAPGRVNFFSLICFMKDELFRLVVLPSNHYHLNLKQTVSHIFIVVISLSGLKSTPSYCTIILPGHIISYNQTFLFQHEC